MAPATHVWSLTAMRPSRGVADDQRARAAPSTASDSDSSCSPGQKNRFDDDVMVALSRLIRPTKSEIGRGAARASSTCRNGLLVRGL